MKDLSMEKFDQMNVKNENINVNDIMKNFNKKFHSNVMPQKGIYGIVEKDLGNGITEHRYRNELGQINKEFRQNDKLFLFRHKNLDNVLRNAKHIEGNYTVKTDAFGRPILNKISDLTLKETAEKRKNMNIKKNDSYRVGDERGHIIADRFGGPVSSENILAQMKEVNRGKYKELENLVAKLKKENPDSRVDYQVKTNFRNNSRRPSSYEPKITIDGKAYDLAKYDPSLKKIYNEPSVNRVKSMKITACEKIQRIRGLQGHETGKQTGLEAAAITCAISTVDNVNDFICGNISAEKMVSEIAKDTGTAGAVGYGVGFISETVARSMADSSHKLIRSIGKTGIPGAAVAVGIDSFDSVVDFAKGEINGSELVYNLGESAASVGGSIAGATTAGAAVGSVVPGAGTAVGAAAGLVGGMVGYAVASEAYQTAVDACAEGAEKLGKKAKQIAADTVDIAKDISTDAADTVKDAINDFSANLPF